MPLFPGVGDGIRHCSCLPWVSSAYRGWPQRGKRRVWLISGSLAGERTGVHASPKLLFSDCSCPADSLEHTCQGSTQ